MVHQYKSPFISVILPTWNRAASLGRAIDSVLGQDYSDFELWVVDDGSTDGTPGLLDGIVDQRLHVLRQARRQGAAAARNAGITHSRGEWVAFMDSDDAWMPGALSGLADRMVACGEEVGVVYAPFVRIKGRRQRIYPPPGQHPEGNLRRVLLYGNLVTPQAALARRDCLEAAGGFDEDLPCLVDWELWLRVARSWRFACHPEPAAWVQASPDGISSDRAALARSLGSILERHGALFAGEPRALAWQNYVLGNLLCLCGEMVAGQERLVQAARLHPGRLRYRLASGLAQCGKGVYRSFYAVRQSLLPDWYW